jgi:hypothetical protein
MMKKVMNLFRKNTDHTKNIPDFPDIGVVDDSDEDNAILPRENDMMKIRLYLQITKVSIYKYFII